jgi:hypothetical protein
MEKNYKNKMVTEGKNKTESKLQEFFYPGGGEYQPLTILAASQEKADELYETQRKKVDQN